MDLDSGGERIFSTAVPKGLYHTMVLTLSHTVLPKVP